MRRLPATPAPRPSRSSAAPASTTSSTTFAHAIVDPGDEVDHLRADLRRLSRLVSLHGGTAVDAPLTADFSLDVDRVLGAVTARTKLIIICTPNNPSGNILDPAAVERIVAEAPCLVAIDEAYAEFAGTPHSRSWTRYPNVCHACAR